MLLDHDTVQKLSLLYRRTKNTERILRDLDHRVSQARTHYEAALQEYLDARNELIRSPSAPSTQEVIESFAEHVQLIGIYDDGTV